MGLGSGIRRKPVKKAPDHGSRIRIRNIDTQDAFFLGKGQSCAITISVEEYEAYEHE